MSKSLFKLAFPVIELPKNRGGRRAIVVFSFTRNDQPNISFATCIDETGDVHQNIPVVTSSIYEASKTPVTFIEAPNERAPGIRGSGIVSPTGRPL